MNRSKSLQASVRQELALEAPGHPRPARRRPSLVGISAVALLLIGLGASPVAAQAPYQQELIPGFSSLVAANYSTPDLMDLDSDGDLDVVVGENSGRIRTFENIGSSMAPVFIERTGTANPFDGIDIGARSSPELVDLDGDGDFDAVIGDFYGGFRYFTNTGTPSTPAFAEGTGSANPFNGIDVGSRSNPELVDLDGDGDLDAVIGGQRGNLRYFANTGMSNAPAFAEATGSANPFDGVDIGSSSSPKLADLDGDGDLDAAVGEKYGILTYFANTGTSKAPAFVWVIGTANPFDGVQVGYRSSPDLADLDGDGDLDVVIGEIYGTLRYFANTGTSTAPAFADGLGTASPFDGADIGSKSQPDLVDLDGDGDLDAVIGEAFGTIQYFANTGSLGAPAFAPATGSANPFDGIQVTSDSSPDLADLDGDGDFDALIGGSGRMVRYFENTGSSTSPGFVEQTGPANPFANLSFDFLSNPDLADLDGDGDLDAVVGGSMGQLVYFVNTGSSCAPAFAQVTGSANPFDGIDVGYSSSPTLMDLDGDGDLDAVVGEQHGLLLYLANTGTSNVPTFAETTGSANPFDGVDVGSYSNPVLVDLEGDGDLDALVGEKGGRLAFFRSIHVVFADGFEGGDTSRWSVTVE